MEKQADDYYTAASEAAKDPKSEKTGTDSSSSHQPDELELAGFVAPTEEEMDTLRHIPDKINWGAYSTFSFSFSDAVVDVAAVIAFVELAERFSVSFPTVVPTFTQLIVPSSQYYGRLAPCRSLFGV